MRRIIMGEGMKIFYIYNTSSGTEYALFLIILFHCLALIRRHYPPGLDHAPIKQHKENLVNDIFFP